MIAHPSVWALSHFQIQCNSMGKYIQLIAHRSFFSNLTLQAHAERIRHLWRRVTFLGQNHFTEVSIANSFPWRRDVTLLMDTSCQICSNAMCNLYQMVLFKRRKIAMHHKYNTVYQMFSWWTKNSPHSIIV